MVHGLGLDLKCFKLDWTKKYMTYMIYEPTKFSLFLQFNPMSPRKFDSSTRN